MGRRVQKGFSLVTAIFLLVVLAALGAAMMTFFTSQQQSSALDVLGSRAYHASRTGIEWGAYQILRNNGGCAAASQTLSAGTLAGTLSVFDIQVACTATAHSEVTATNGNITVFSITSTATRGAAGQADFVERQLQVTIGQ